MSSLLNTLRLTNSSKSLILRPVTFLNNSGSRLTITSFRLYSLKSVRYMKTGMRVANLMSFCCISFRLLLYSFSASLNSFFSFCERLSPLSRFVFFTCSLLLMMVSMSWFSERKPSILINAFIASGEFISRLKVTLSTFTSTALSHLLANNVAVVPLIAISSIPAASISFIELPSYASTGRN